MAFSFFILEFTHQWEVFGKMKSVILVHNFGKFAPLHSSGDGVVVGGVGLDVVVPDGDVGDLLDQARIQL